MNVIIVICILLAAGAAVFALIRGIVTFLKTTEEDLKNGNGPSQSSLRQNKMMMTRVTFQAIAVLLVALLLLLNGSK